ncbi:MAG: hypothetical protein WCI36_04710 [bacterium]
MQIFDLTANIQLGGKLKKQYNALRLLLHIIFALTMLFIIYRILFPIVPLDFAMDTPNSTKNTLVNPRIAQSGEFPPKATMQPNETLLFNANPVGQFSKANITLALAKNSAGLENAEVKIKKSYQAFFYPTGEPIGFKDGTLLSTSNGNYYLISNKKLRKFANTDTILKLGYPKSAFLEVAQDDLRLNKKGEDIVDVTSYPEDTIFAIDDTYYQLKNQQLVAFVSTRAFLSQYKAQMAVAKNSDFLSNYPIAETFLGFCDGTLGSSADSVFILSEGKSYPIENAVTFEAMGYSWDDVIALTSDELGVYKKQKQFINSNPHPNGTIFIDQDSGKYFLIKDKQKIPLEISSTIQTYNQKPIVASMKSSEIENTCTLKKKFLSSTNFECAISLENIESLLGNDYELSIQFPAAMKISTLNTTFSTPMTTSNLRNSLSIIKTRLKNR